jgi:hypothetical protein
MADPSLALHEIQAPKKEQPPYLIYSEGSLADEEKRKAAVLALGGLSSSHRAQRSLQRCHIVIDRSAQRGTTA